MPAFKGELFALLMGLKLEFSVIWVDGDACCFQMLLSLFGVNFRKIAKLKHVRKRANLKDNLVKESCLPVDKLCFP